MQATDEYGTWEIINDNAKSLLIPSQKWKDENPTPTTKTSLTEKEKLIALLKDADVQAAVKDAATKV